MPGPVFVEGDSISLRTIEESDHEFLYRHENDVHVRLGLGRSTPLERDTIAEMLDRDSSVAFLPCRGDEPVGYVWLWGIDVDDGRGELGYWIRPDERGKGYATEAVSSITGYAFGERRLHKVAARVWAWNEASQRVLEKVGFQREGTLREDVFVDGEHVDVHMYGVLARDWDHRTRGGQA